MAHIIKEIMYKLASLESRLTDLEARPAVVVAPTPTQIIQQVDTSDIQRSIAEIAGQLTKYIRDNNEVRKVTEQMITLKIESHINKKIADFLVHQATPPPTYESVVCADVLEVIHEDIPLVEGHAIIEVSKEKDVEFEAPVEVTKAKGNVKAHIEGFETKRSKKKTLTLE